MNRKMSILKLTTIGLLLSAAGRCDDTKESFVQQDDEFAAISGIRALEYLRRRIIESPGDEVDEKVPPIENDRNYRRLIGDEVNEEEKFPGRRYHPRRHVNSEMFKALSKLANIQIADPRIDHLPAKNIPGGNSGAFNGNSKGLKSESSTKSTGVFDDTGLIPRKFQCRPISEMYIPSVEKKMPAYLCVLGKKAFVISSERFNQDSRDRFVVSVDDVTFNRLSPMNFDMSRLTSGVSVLPATLILKRGDDGYIVRGIKDDSKRDQSTGTFKDNL